MGLFCKKLSSPHSPPSHVRACAKAMLPMRLFRPCQLRELQSAPTLLEPRSQASNCSNVMTYQHGGKQYVAAGPGLV
jgi:hypothetical protein